MTNVNHIHMLNFVVNNLLLLFISHLTSSCSSSSKNGGLEADGAKSGVPPEADFVALAAQVGG